MYRRETETRGSFYTGARAAERTERGGLRGGVIALCALLLGVVIGMSIPKKQEPAHEREAKLLPLTPQITNTASPTEDAEGSPSPEETGEAVVSLPSREITVSIGGSPVKMDLEEYLVGVVAGEMSASGEPEALKAQAVAARTFTALHMAGKTRCRSGCTVCDDVTCCQAYADEERLRTLWGSSYDAYIAKIRAAVKDTEGIVSVYDGELINAFYHASSGPSTESSEEVFAMALPYLVSVDSCEGEHEMVSRQEFTCEEAFKKLNEAFPEAELKLPFGAQDFDIWGRTKSGRVQLVRLGATVVSGAQLRRALGLKSTAFEIERKGDAIVFTCTGYGHGVGMSQLGANEMAKSGAGFEEILEHFYTGSSLSKLVYGG
ncbi:MAG: stage II sporulation protein D [Clostridia bacterium]|nr:stage II sporulation protein D [Clostridia bacterium]